jgi:hypothetical protein
MGGITGPKGESCGIDEYPRTGKYSGNFISNNIVSDAYCDVAYAPPDVVASGTYLTRYIPLDNSKTPFRGVSTPAI